MESKYLKIFLPLLISILSFWMWRIFNHSLVVALLIIFLSFTLFSKKVYLSYLLLFLISILIFGQAYDKNIFISSGLEKDRLQIEEKFYAAGFGKLYENRIGVFIYKNVGLPVYKLQRNFFYNLDPNQYFFAGHPRERTDALEFDKFSALFLPFFVIGLYITVVEPCISIILFIVITSIVGTFVSPGYALGPILFFPVLIYFISLGMERILLWLKNIFY